MAIEKENIHILIIDDQPNNLRFISNILTKEGYKVQRAISGTMAINANFTVLPDLILLDIAMPKMNGYEVCERLKANERTRQVPVIFLSIFNETFHKVKAFEVGGVDYITKPFQVEEFLVRIESQLTIQQLSKQLKQQNAQLQREVEFRKRTEQALRESKARLQKLAVNIPGVIYQFVKNSEGSFKFEYISYACQKIYELESEDILKNPELCFDQHHPDDREYLGEKIADSARTLEPFAFEWRIVTPSGKLKWLQSNSRPEMRDNGDIVWYGVLFDISDRKQAEAARSQINQTLEALIRACPLAITVLGADDGTVKMWNPAAERIFGWSESEAVGQFVPSIPPDKREEFMANLKGIRAGNAIAGMETQRQRKDGSSIDIGLWATPVRDGNGNINCMSILADISDRKQVEAERAQLLDREQAARAQAEAINRLKDEFLATLSHELRTPLNAILGWAQMLRRGKYTEASLATGLEAIERQSRVQVQLVEDLLDVSRIIQGKLALKPGWFDMVKTIEVALNSVRFAAEAKSVTVTPEFDPAVGLMSGDTQRLQQVVSNLLTNAVKFTPAGGTVRLRLSAVALTDSPSPNYVQITVSDTGKGISAEFLPYVFDRFRQADGSITRADSGLGLGLAIVRHLVELHRGTVRAESPGEGLGATFTVMLPLKQRRNQQSQLREERKFPQMRPGMLAGLKVLVVDDEPDNREFLIVALQQLGATTTAAASAAEAIELLQQSPPDILVSDIGMPVEDGYSLIRKVRSSEWGTAKRLPAVALTAYASEQDRDRASAAGYDEHLAKPIEPAVLAAVLAKLKNSQ